MKRILVLGFLLSLSILVGGFLNRGAIRDLLRGFEKPTLPEPQAYSEFITSPQAPPQDENESLPTTTEEIMPITTPAEEPLPPEKEVSPSTPPAQINLAVPFTSQAPYANWSLPYQEACEEASLLMVARYKKGESIPSPDDANQEILKLVEFQNGFLGDYKDTTAEQTAEIAREYYGFKNTIVKYDLTIDDIKKEVAAGNPVIVPAAGRQLPNPYFRSPGPLYHMLVIRGYTATKFITNDPGTKRGEEFVYTYNGLLDAVHDWNGGDVEHGRKVMIVIK